MSEIAQSVRAVLEAARMWRSHLAPLHLEQNEEDLASAVDAMNALFAAEQEKNRPIGFVLPRPWSAIEPGWFVRTPKGEWIEVLDNEEHADGKARIVSLRIDGSAQTFTYPGDRSMSVRKGSHPPVTMEDAVALFMKAFPGSQILTDGM